MRESLLEPVPVGTRASADELLTVLLTDPVLIVQEDFAVELSVDWNTAAGRRAQEMAAALQPQLPNCGLGHLINVIRDWTGRWAPLTLLTRGPADPPPAFLGVLLGGRPARRHRSRVRRRADA